MPVVHPKKKKKKKINLINALHIPTKSAKCHTVKGLKNAEGKKAAEKVYEVQANN